MEFVAEEGTYECAYVRKYVVDLNKDQVKCVNSTLKESTMLDPTDGGTKKVDILMPDRLLVLKGKGGKELCIDIRIKDNSEIEYLLLAVPEEEKEKLDQLVRILEKELQAKKKRKV